MTRAIRIARKKIRVLGAKALESNLQAFCGSYAEAYEQGVDEAQREIVVLRQLLLDEGRKHGTVDRYMALLRAVLRRARDEWRW